MDFNSIPQPFQKTNKQYRKIRISNYRNIGVSQHGTYLTINHSSSVKELGELVILIGPNNCGKSNVLDAVYSLSKGITQRDVTYIGDTESIKKPSVVMEISFNDERYYYDGASKNKKYLWDNIDYDYFRENFMSPIISKLLREKDTEKTASKYPYIDESNRDECLTFILETIDVYWKSNNLGSKGNTELFDRFVEELDLGSNNDIIFENKNHYKLCPQIIKYNESHLTNKDLYSHSNPFNRFIQNVIERLGGKKSYVEILQIYKKGLFNQLTILENKFNVQLDCVADEFNALYSSGKIKYKFKMKLTEEHIIFEIYLGKEKQNYEWSSTGFKWFFEFYFNFLYDKHLCPGDLILMDEPALNIHVAGQIELRNIIKQFAKKNDITFIMSTHSPFMIDCDHLEELRIVTHIPDGTSSIINGFHLNVYGHNNDNPDNIEGILSALTIGRHVIRDQKCKLFFVEGITDYLYLTAFKKYLNVNDVMFIPVGGVGDDKYNVDKPEHIVEFITKIEYEPVMIVDGDSGGDRIKCAALGTKLKVIQLSDIPADEKINRPTSQGPWVFRQIESLFSFEDKAKYIPVKETNTATVFKNNIEDGTYQLSNRTIQNFKSLFEYILDRKIK